MMVNILARSVTKWNRACRRNIDTIHKLHQLNNTILTTPFCWRRNTGLQTFFRRLLLLKTCKIPNQTSCGVCYAYLEHKHLFTISGCARSEPQVSHSSSESEIISSDAYPHSKCGIVYWNHVRIPMIRRSLRAQVSNVTLFHILLINFLFDTFDHVPSEIPESSFPASFCFSKYEDNEAVIRMIIKGHSPDWRTQLVDLDGLFARVNLDASISI